MLTGKEKIKNLSDDDILNYVCNRLGTQCVKGYFEYINHERLGEYRVLKIQFQNPFLIHRMSFVGYIADNITLNQTKNIMLLLRNNWKLRQERTAE